MDLQNLTISLVLLVSMSSVFADHIDITAYEYVQRFKKQLSIGECPMKFVAYPNGNQKEPCPFPKRTGTPRYREKTVNTTQLFLLADPAELFKIIRLCDGKSANYFGLLIQGDCVAAEIASKLSFKRKHVTLMRHDYYRPRVNVLTPSDNLAVPDEFTQYLSNVYYTKHIDIGTEEVIIVDMQFSDIKDAEKAKGRFNPSGRLADNLQIIGEMKEGRPRKVKVIRLSTAGNTLETRVYKLSKDSKQPLFAARGFVLDIEHSINKLREDLLLKRLNTHLKYGFKTYEIGPIALPFSSVPEDAVHENWNNVSLLQVESERAYVTNKRYRKQCRNRDSANTKLRKFCPLIKHALMELKRARITIRTQRRDWNQLSFEEQTTFINTYRISVKKLKMSLKMTTKEVKRELKLIKYRIQS